MPDTRETADAALARLQRIMARWPKPGDGQGVQPAAVLAGMAPLVPLAEMVGKLKVGYGKGYYAGAGYLSGSPKVTEADLQLARAVIRDVRTVLPAVVAADGVLSRLAFAQLKGRAYAFLGLAADLDVTAVRLAKVGTAASSAWDPWISFAVVDVGAAAFSGATEPQLLMAQPIEVGGSANQGAADARKLTDDMLALKHSIEVREVYDKIMAGDPSFVPSFEAMLAGWNDFLKGVSGANVAWYNLPGKLWTTVSDRWIADTTNFNVVQDYRAKFNAHYARVQALLGKQPTPSAPEAPKARKEDRTLGEDMDKAADKLVTGLLIVGGAVGGGFLLLKLAGK